MLDEVAPEILFIASAGTIVVCGLMVLVWYLSTGQEQSSKKKKKEDEKEADVGGKSKRKKQHLSPRKRKEAVTKSEDASNDPLETASQPKSILKENKDEQPSPRPHHVDFQKEVPATKESKPLTRTHLPTPHPQANARLPSLTKEGTDDVKPKSSTKEEKKQASAPQSKSTDKTSPKPKLAKSSDVSNGPSTDQQLPSKKKTKSKQPSTSEGSIVNGIVWSRYNNVLFGEQTRLNNRIFRWAYMYLNFN